MTDTLVLEVNESCVDRETFIFPDGCRFKVTPAIGEDYWLFRVQVGYGQAVLGFPKFWVIGIGFAKESDWNTNLPSSCSAEEIFRHIKHNKGHKEIKDEVCLEAIRMIQAAVKAWRKEA